MNNLRNERGFMLLNVVFLTLITSFAAMILMNAAPRLKNPQAALRLTAIHLANEQFAMMESKAAAGTLDLSCQVKPEDLTTKNFSEGVPINFTVTSSEKSSNGNLHTVAVEVAWTVGGQDASVKLERTIRVVTD
ncbi:MAG: hypothetical protein IJL12_08340 [Selenomonadaceae bacterium]|nr:hypothetical protein [Selenomonadaceae bacterium]MBQ6132329.1 hypothetical protein [Selenomonadaceae bacterium]